MIQRPRGTRDFTQEEMITRKVIENDLRTTALRFGYFEIATPTFENAELFIRKSGPEIVGQLYTFTDKGGRELVLRPELTAPVIRFYANELYKQPKPLKIFYLGNCFRYERPQKGRFREFWQFGAELIGTDKPEGIAELITFAVTCLANVGLKTYDLRLGDLEFLRNILADWAFPTERQGGFLNALDKGDVDSLTAMLQDENIPARSVEAFLELIQTKFDAAEFETKYELLLDQFPVIKEHLERFKNVVLLLRRFGITEFTIDLGIARGLDYYTGIVFEIDVGSLGAEKQVCGGGEYSLGELFQIKDIACSGFAIGFDRVTLAYNLEGLIAEKPQLDIFIIPLSTPGLHKAIELANLLRIEGFNIDMDLKDRNMSKNLKYASSRKVKYVVFLGEDELDKGSALVRAMNSGDQTEVAFGELVNYFQNLA